MKTKRLVLPILLLIMFFVPLAKAQFGDFGNYIVSDMLKSEFFHFVLVFLFFFAICYFALKKIIFGEEPAIASIVAIIISFFITNSFFEYFEEFLASSKTVFYVILFGAFLAVIVLIRLFLLLVKLIGGLTLMWISGVYIIFFYILNTKLIPFKYRSTILSGNFGHLLWVIAIFAAFIIIFTIFKRLSKRGAVIEERKEGEKT